MASINSSSSATANNIYSALAAKNKGIGGLATGLDTDSLVEALTAGTRNRIASQQQKKTLLGWQMTAYRGVATSLRAFQSKYFDYLNSATCIRSPSYFSAFKGTSTSDKISVRPGTGASTGKIVIQDVVQMAEYKTINSAATGQQLVGNKDMSELLNQDLTGKTLRLDFNGSVRTVKLDSLSNMNSANDFAAALTDLIKTQYGSDCGVAATVSGDNKLMFTAGTSQLVVATDCEALGLTEGMSNRILKSSKIGALAMFRDVVGDEFSFVINGVEITARKDEMLSTVMSRINNSGAGVKINYQTHTDRFTLTATECGDGNTIDMRDIDGNFLNVLFGAQGGSRVGGNSTLYTELENPVGTENMAGALSTLIGSASGEDLEKLLQNTTMKMTIGSKTVTLNLDYTKFEDEFSGSMTLEEKVAFALNRQIENAAGADTGVSFYLSGGKLALDVDNNRTKVSLAAGAADAATGKSDALALFGLSAQSNDKISLGYNAALQGNFTYATAADRIDAFEALLNQTATMNLVIGGVEKEISFTLDQANLNNIRPGLPEGYRKEDWDPAEHGGTEWSFDAAYAALKDDAQNSVSGAQEKLDEFEVEYAKNIKEGMANALNSVLQQQFGKNTGVSFAMYDDGLKLNIQGDVKVELKQSGDLTGKVDMRDLLGFAATGAPSVRNYGAGQGTRLTSIAGVSAGNAFTMNIDGVGFSYTVGANTTVQDLMEAVNAQFGEGTLAFSGGKLTLDAGDRVLKFDDTSGGAMKALFGHSSYETAVTHTSGIDVQEGKNAIIILGDGSRLISNSNNFNVNGVDFEILGEIDGPVTLNVTTDPGEVVDKIKTFVDEYNAVVATLTGILNEERNSEYQPLTDEQKAEMTADQIKAWETEAKKGILRNDATLRRILSDMRAVMYEKVEAAGLSMYDIGITTQSLTSGGSVDYSKSGQLVIDEKKLRAAIEQNPDAVAALFTDENGIANRLNTVIDDAVRTNSTNQGSLVRMAGTEQITGNNQSALSKQIDSIDAYITRLKARLESEYNRYWKKFSALETAISNMNTQSSWLADFGS